WACFRRRSSWPSTVPRRRGWPPRRPPSLP
ncbi:MAG: hypothetical protein AVDCRST_MAG22-3596, partial [uncultured Rubrobacteraceae bacterium]